MAKFIGCGYSKKFHNKIKSDLKEKRYLNKIRQKKEIGEIDVKTLTPFGQVMHDYRKDKENL